MAASERCGVQDVEFKTLARVLPFVEVQSLLEFIEHGSRMV
jgi:hypothetical protein